MIKRIFSLSPWFYFFFLPLVYFPFLAEPFEYPKVILFVFSAYLIIGLYYLQIIIGNIHKVKINKIIYLILIYFTIMLISSMMNSLRSPNLFGHYLYGQYYRYQGLITLGGYLLFCFFFSQTQFCAFKLKKVIRPIFWGAIITAVLIIIQGIILKVFHLPVINLNGRLAGHLGNPNFAAGFLALAWIYSYRPKQWYLGLIFLAAILFTGSRSGLIALAVGGILLVLFQIGSKKWLYLVIILLSSILLLFSIWRPRSSFEDQAIIWSRGIEAFSRRPVLGWGVDNFANAFQSVLKPTDFDLKNIRVDKAHNEFLEVAVAGGIIGLSVYLWITFEAIKTFWRNRSNWWAERNLIVLVSFIALSQFNVLSICEYLFFYFALANAVSLSDC